MFLNSKGEKTAETRFETHSFLDGHFDMWRKEISIKMKGNIFPSDFFVNILMEHFDLIWKILTSLCCDVSVRLPSNANPYKETGRILHLKWLWIQIRAIFCKLSRVNGRLGDQGESISLYEVKYLVPPFKDWNIFSNMALNDYYLPSDLYSLVNMQHKTLFLLWPAKAPIDVSWFVIFLSSLLWFLYWTFFISLPPCSRSNGLPGVFHTHLYSHYIHQNHQCWKS